MDNPYTNMEQQERNYLKAMLTDHKRVLVAEVTKIEDDLLSLKLADSSAKINKEGEQNVI